jgi:hypothetical protein
VDAPHLVAATVLTDQGVVLAHDADPVRPRLARAAAPTRGAHRREGEDLGGDHDLAGGHELPVQLDEAEGVGGADPERSGGEAAADPAEHRVLDLAAPAQVGLVDEEPGSGAELARHLVLEHQDAGRQPAVLAEGDPTPHGRAERHLRRLHRTLAGQPEPRPRDQHGRHDRQGQQQQGDPHDVTLAGDHRHEQGDEAGDDEEAAPPGEHAPRTRHD